MRVPRFEQLERLSRVQRLQKTNKRWDDNEPVDRRLKREMVDEDFVSEEDE